MIDDEESSFQNNIIFCLAFYRFLGSHDVVVDRLWANFQEFSVPENSSVTSFMQFPRLAIISMSQVTRRLKAGESNVTIDSRPRFP
jgi:hypothetical protein